MTTLAQVRNRVDSRLTTLWQDYIRPRQETYYNRAIEYEVPVYDEEGNQTGTTTATRYPRNYWQGLASHSIVPQHTSTVDGDSVPDRLTIRPSDVPENWTNFIPELNQSLPMALTVDVYESPFSYGVIIGQDIDGNDIIELRNTGYVAQVFVRYQGNLYTRAQNYGPEAWRTFDWVRVEEEQ